MFEVIVGNVGRVYEGNDYSQAVKDYEYYCDVSNSNCGRAGGESVFLCEDGEPLMVFTGYDDVTED